MTRRMILSVSVLAFAAPLLHAPAVFAQLEHDRGNIVSINWNQLTMDFKDPKGRIATRKFARDATVKFTDGARFFPNPSTKDLRPPMYVHYVFEHDVIQSFDVVELGFTPGSGGGTGGTKQQGIPRTVVGRLTAFDARVRQVELEVNGVRETFQLSGKASMNGLAAGQRVQLKTEWSGQKELVYELRVVGR